MLPHFDIVRFCETNPRTTLVSTFDACAAARKKCQISEYIVNHVNQRIVNPYLNCHISARHSGDNISVDTSKKHILLIQQSKIWGDIPSPNE